MSWVTQVFTTSTTKLVDTPGWDAGARTIAELTSDGGFTFSVGQSIGIVCGLNTTDATAGYREIQHGFFIESNRFKIIESGVQLGNWFNYSPGAVFKVARSLGVVKYYRNNILIYTSLTASTGTVFLDCSMYAYNDTIIDATLFLYSTANPVGSELLINGDFATDLSDWTSTGWTFDDGSANSDASNTNPLSQDVNIAEDSVYQLQVTVDGNTTGTLRITIDGVDYTVEIDNTTGTVLFTNENGETSTAKYITNPDGSITIIIDFVGSDTDTVTLSLTPSSDFDGVIDTVSLKEILEESVVVDSTNLLANGDLTTDLSGWGSTGWVSNSGGAENTLLNIAALTQSVDLQGGQSYQLQVVVSNTTQGTITITIDGVEYVVTIDNTAGTISYTKADGSSGSLSFITNPDGSITVIIDFTAASTGNYLLSITPTGDFDGLIDSVFLATTIGSMGGTASINGYLSALSALGVETGNDDFISGLFLPITASAVMTDTNYINAYLPKLIGVLVEGGTSLNTIESYLLPLTVFSEDTLSYVPDYNLINIELRALQTYGLQYDPDPALLDGELYPLIAKGSDVNIQVLSGNLSPLTVETYLGVSVYLVAEWPSWQASIVHLIDNAYSFFEIPAPILTAEGNDYDNIRLDVTVPAPILTAVTGAVATLSVPAPVLTSTGTVQAIARAELEVPAPELTAVASTQTRAIVELEAPAPTLAASTGAYASLEVIAPVLTATGSVGHLAWVKLTLPFIELTATAKVGTLATVELEIPAPTLEATGIVGVVAHVVLVLPAIILTATGRVSPGVGIDPVDFITETTYAVNLNTGAVTTLLLGEFIKLVTAHGRLYGLRAGELVRLDGDLDGVTTIPAVIRFAPQSFGSNLTKRINAVYLSSREDDGLTLDLIEDETIAWRYQTDTDTAPAYGTHRVKVGRGVKFHTAGLALYNRNGGRMDVGGMELIVDTATRRPKS